MMFLGIKPWLFDYVNILPITYEVYIHFDNFICFLAHCQISLQTFKVK